MKYCSNCGAELNENADICLNCGILIKEQIVKTRPDGRTLGIIGLFVWIIPLAGWIVSGIGLSQANEADNQSAVRLNTIGLVLSSVMFVINIILLS